jgi:hypothetical protein
MEAIWGATLDVGEVSHDLTSMDDDDDDADDDELEEDELKPSAVGTQIWSAKIPKQKSLIAIIALSLQWKVKWSLFKFPVLCCGETRPSAMLPTCN